jgi:DNA-binding NtrC family response regulator
MNRTRKWESPAQSQHKSKVAIATADSSVQSSLSKILEGFSIEAIWLKNTDDVRRAFARDSIACFLCGFWLENGTYREAVKHIKKQVSQVPFLMVSTPGATNEYRDYLASLNVGAFDFICYPYQEVEVKRILQAALAERQRLLNRDNAIEKNLVHNLAWAASVTAAQESPNPRAA